LKDQFPDVQIFGPVHYGFGGIYDWQGELGSTPDGSDWFPDKYLLALKAASTRTADRFLTCMTFIGIPRPLTERRGLSI